MDQQRFDEITRTLATGSSRRGVLRGIVGGALAAMGLSRAAAKKQPRVEVCHYDADGDRYFLITVNGNALQAHLNHGDTQDYGMDTRNCGECGNGCPMPENGSALCTDGACGIVCDDGYEPDGAGGCALIPGICPVASGADNLIGCEDDPQCVCVATYGGGNACARNTFAGSAGSCESNEDCQDGQICWNWPGSGGNHYCVVLCSAESSAQRSMTVEAEPGPKPSDSN